MDKLTNINGRSARLAGWRLLSTRIAKLQRLYAERRRRHDAIFERGREFAERPTKGQEVMRPPDGHILRRERRLGRLLNGLLEVEQAVGDLRGLQRQ